MKLVQSFQYGVTSLAICSVCLPTSFSFGTDAIESTATNSAPQPGSLIRDVALAPGGLLVGQILDDTLQPVRGAEVAVQVDGQTMAATTTDTNGVFAVAGLRGGIHEVVTRDSMENCRFWAPGTAPPHAVQNLRFVPGQNEVIRGQWGPPASYNSLACQAKALATNPFVIGGVIATAIAVPIILNNIDDDDSGS